MRSGAEYSLKILVEVRGIEPLAPCLQSRCSPAELHPHIYPTEGIKGLTILGASLPRDEVAGDGSMPLLDGV